MAVITQAPRGTEDVLPEEAVQWQVIEAVMRSEASLHGFGEVRTPVFEHTELFQRGVGDTTDVVQKEMYTFPDRKGRSLTMRPEATAGVMRAYIESGRSADAVTKLFTIGPMFRYERPQKGRMRQFHQINCECLGPSEPYADAELVTMAMRFLEAIGLRNLTLQLNSLGCPSCRPAYRDTLRQWLSSLDESALCEDCRRRMVTNPLRVLDCKVPTCKEHTAAAPKILDHNCPDCAAHFDTVRRLLDAEKVPYVINHRLVRGLDYYTRTTFEIVSDEIGAQGTVAGGGRYDGLVAQLGGPNVPGFGFACGMERLALLLPDSEEDREAARPDFYVVVLADAARDSAYALTQALRDAGFRGEMGFAVRSVKSAMRQAGKSGARFCLLIGEDELAARTVMLKNMDSGEQASVAFADVVARLQK